MRRTATATLVVIAIAFAGCGGGGDSDSDGGPDVAALKTSFNELAAQAYEDAGKSRDDDYASGTTIEGCFAADDETIGAAVGIDDLAFTDEGFLQGLPEQEERLLCSVEKPEGTDGPPPVVNLGAGTTTLDRDQLLQRLINTGEGNRSELEGEAEGLDPSTTLAATGDGVSQFIWVDDDFTVGVVGPEDELSAEEGFAALKAAVDGVSRTLSE